MNVYEIVTEKIIEKMKGGIIPWQKPWSAADAAISYTSRKPYSLLNQMLLGRAGEYLTANQINSLGGHIKKGAKGDMVVFFQMVKTKKAIKDKETGEDEELISVYPVLRYYYVFHIDNTEGIPSKLVQKPAVVINPIDSAERVISDYVEREHGLEFVNDTPSNQAYYSLIFDRVVVPMLSQFDCAEQYYSTTFHELTHSTLKASRCNREADNANSFFGNEDYSREELVAEMGAAMLCGRCGLEAEKTFDNSVAYLQNWLSALSNDSHMIVWAASRAEKAAKYILNEQ